MDLVADTVTNLPPTPSVPQHGTVAAANSAPVRRKERFTGWAASSANAGRTTGAGLGLGCKALSILAANALARTSRPGCHSVTQGRIHTRQSTARI